MNASWYVNAFIALGGMSILTHIGTEILPRLVAVTLHWWLRHPSVHMALIDNKDLIMKVLSDAQSQVLSEINETQDK